MPISKIQKKEQKKAQKLAQKINFEARIRSYGVSRLAREVLLRREATLDVKEKIYFSRKVTSPAELTHNQLAYFRTQVTRQGFRMSRSGDRISLIDLGTTLKLKKKSEKIYVIREEDSDFAKIGYCTCEKKRIGSLQIGNPRPLYISMLVPLEGVITGRRAENEVHKKLSRYKIRGEWFRNVDESLVENILQNLILNIQEKRDRKHRKTTT